MNDQINSESTPRIIDLTPHVSDTARSCKFILVKYNDIVHLVFGDLSAYRYHAHLFRKFCEDRKVEYSANHDGDVVEAHDLAITVSGGGLLELDLAMRTAKFSGASKAYGPFSRPKLESVLSADHSFDRLKVTIR